jgi:glycerol-3-phosphate responsive antiterminator
MLDYSSNQYIIGLLNKIADKYELDVNDLLEIHVSNIEDKSKNIKTLTKNVFIEYLIINNKEYFVDEKNNVYNYKDKNFVGVYDYENEVLKLVK